MFKTVTHQRLFNILLVDFLSQPKQWPFGLTTPPAQASKSERSVLYHLKRICDEPKLNPVGGDVFRMPLEEFLQWLEAECCIDGVWLPSINLKIDIKVKGIAFIKICGNIAKHNFTRLTWSVHEICEILEANGADIGIDQGYVVVPEFYEWFHTHVFSYHSSAIAEFLNNIRWGIYDYLRPEYSRSLTREDPGSIDYRYEYPPHCNEPVAQTMYWNLMNAIRSEPYVPKFGVSRYLKMSY